MVRRRDFLKTAAGAVGAAFAVPASLEMHQESAGPLRALRPMLAIPGEFSIRHEDCMVIGGEKGRLFMRPGKSIDDPFA